jgi:integrase/recombinase XerD
MEITIKPILWIYKEVKENEKNLVVGEHEVRIRMTQNRIRTYMATGFSSSPMNWDSEKDYPKPDHPRFKDLAAKIDKLVVRQSSRFQSALF